MKKIVLPILFLFILTAVSIGGVFVWWNTNSAPVSTQRENKPFVIKKGASNQEIANNLEKQGLLKNALVFRIYTKLKGLEKSIPAGEYILSPHYKVEEILEVLLKGPTEIWVTIPEGLRREEIAERLTQSFELTAEKKDAFYNQFLSLTKDKEGYLFPDTYLFPKDATPQKVFDKLSSTFSKKLQANEIPQTRKDIIILASLLERETANASEGPIVAGILLKRLDAGWPLQVDAAVQYAVGKKGEWWPILTKAHLEVNSPYNTYKFTGLPPAPIANPGIETIVAAANPEESPYWFYIHDPKGQIHYAKTVEEHNQNVRKYLGK